jgi:predicted CXXCH cytochrome family protein
MGTPGCATCHENHAIREPSDKMLGTASEAVCSGCHGANDKGGQTAAQMRALIDALAARTDRARAVLGQAEHAGMEVSQAQFDLNGARDALVKARTAVHAFRLDAVKQEVEPGLAVSDKAHGRGVRALDELRFRRKGLGVSLVIILAVMAGLVVKIRQVDRRPPRDAHHG